MRTLLWILVASGCGGTVQHGSFLHAGDGVEAALAADAADKLAADYGQQADSRAVVLQHAAVDAFGRALSAGLRERGFRVYPAGQGPGSRLSLSYVADAIKGTDLLRVIVEVEGRQLSRAYRRQARGVRPAGPWVARGRR